MVHALADWGYLQARLCEQEAATAEQSACAQQLQEAVETGKGKLAESAAFMQKLQDEQSRAREQIAEYAAQVMNKHSVRAYNLSMYAHMFADFQVLLVVLMLRQICSTICQSNDVKAMRSPMLLAIATAGAILSLLTLLPSLELCDPGRCTWGSPCITMQVTSLRELHQQAQKYNSQLQEYNTKLQQDVALSNDSLQKLQVHLTLPHAVLLPAFQNPVNCLDPG